MLIFKIKYKICNCCQKNKIQRGSFFSLPLFLYIFKKIRLIFFSYFASPVDAFDLWMFRYFFTVKKRDKNTHFSSISHRDAPDLESRKEWFIVHSPRVFCGTQTQTFSRMFKLLSYKHHLNRTFHYRPPYPGLQRSHDSYFTQKQYTEAASRYSNIYSHHSHEERSMNRISFPFFFWFEVKYDFLHKHSQREKQHCWSFFLFHFTINCVWNNQYSQSLFKGFINQT